MPVAQQIHGIIVGPKAVSPTTRSPRCRRRGRNSGIGPNVPETSTAAAVALGALGVLINALIEGASTAAGQDRFSHIPARDVC